MPPENYELQAFHQVYTADVLNRIAERAKHDKGLQGLIWILRGDNEYPKIDRIHLDKCLCFAKENGGIDADTISRLSNTHLIKNDCQSRRYDVTSHRSRRVDGASRWLWRKFGGLRRGRPREPRHQGFQVRPS